MKKIIIGLSILILILIVFFAMNKNENEHFTENPPKNGIIFQSGGFMSSWYAYVVDFDSLTIAKYQDPNRLLVAKKNLKQDDANQLLQLSGKAIIEDKRNQSLSADVNFRLDLSIDGKVSSTQTYGPLPDKGSINDVFNFLSK